MAFEDVVVRVRSKIGISRLCFRKNSTLGELKKELRNRIQFSDGSVVKLFIEGTNTEVTGPDEVLLRDIGIKHGTSLFLDQSSSDLKYTNIHSGVDSRDLVDEIEIDESDASCSRDERSSSSYTINSKTSGIFKITNLLETEGPLFKSFDAYLHDNGFAIGDLPLKNSYLPVKLKKGGVNKLPKSVTIRHQKYRHVDHLEMMNVDEVRNFANYWMNDLEMSFQRIGWMYGYYTEDNHYPYGIRAVCEAIYEPPQISQINDVTLMDDDMFGNVEKIAQRLGLERIGMIFTRLPNECFLTAKELMRSIEMQYNSLKLVHYTKYPISTMVTCTVSPDDNGQPVLNVFMASDLALALYRDELFQNTQDYDNVIKIREGEDKNELMPILMESGREVTSFDTSWLIVRINESAPIKPNSFFQRGSNRGFPVENRSYSSNKLGTSNAKFDSARITNSGQFFKKLDKKILTDYFNTGGTNPWKDFHLLIYISKVLDIDTALSICDAIVNQEPIDDLIKDLLLQS